MSRNSRLVLDPYDRGARLYPALITLFPAILAGAAWLPHLLGREILGLLVSLAGGCGLLVLLAHIARDAGAALEGKWFAMQGGKPSTALLRHRDGRLPAPLKARYHSFLSGRVPGMKIPTAEQELSDHAAADAAYEAAAAWLREQSRDKARFGLLFQRNVDYGFRRNLTALRRVALWIDATLGVTALAALAVWHLAIMPQSVVPPAATSLFVFVVAVIHGAFATMTLRPDWVHRASESYARQLLASSDILGAATSPAQAVGPTPKTRRQNIRAD